MSESAPFCPQFALERVELSPVGSSAGIKGWERALKSRSQPEMIQEDPELIRKLENAVFKRETE